MIEQNSLKIFLKKSKLIPEQKIKISGSKSESNRLLILQKLYGNFEILNLSNAEDTQLLKKALNTDSQIIDIHHAGTAMRFLTAYFAIMEGKTTILTGSERMKERPIFPLVEALRQLGANIEYLENEGFPPLKIIGKKITQNEIEIPAHISSQFITALLLIAPKLENGLKINLLGKTTSLPYLKMTLEMISKIIQQNIEITKNQIFIKNNSFENPNFSKKMVESDWSSASYFYSLTAIGREKITLETFKKKSLQGDKILSEIYEKFFGIKTIFHKNQSIELFPMENFSFPEKIKMNLNACPDIAQTLCVTASAKKIPFEFTGLETLKIKETDRLFALKNELEKIGVKTRITENSIESLDFFSPEKEIFINTYHDHRMAMSFAPLCLIKNLEIENPKVVEKSYPDFWKDFFSVLKII